MTDDDLLARWVGRVGAEDGGGRRLRLAANLSLKQAARAVGVAESSVSRWETGRVRPTGSRAVRYGRLLQELFDTVGRPA